MKPLYQSRFLRYLLVVGGAVGCVLLFLLASASANTALFERQYNWLLGLNIVMTAALLVLVLLLVGRLIAGYREGRFGTRLTARLALSFALMGVVPGVAIYVISVQFLSRSIESWFNVRVDTALESGLNLGQAALDSLLGELNTKARNISLDMIGVPEGELPARLARLRDQSGAQEAVVFTASGKVLAYAGNRYASLLPDLPSPTAMRQLRLTGSYSRAEGDNDSADARSDLKLRVVVTLAARTAYAAGSTLGGPLANDPRYLQLLQPVPDALARNAQAVLDGYRDYEKLSLSRDGLRKIYSVTLTLALLLAVFAAIAVAFFLSGRLAAPLLTLAEGTRAVADGDFRALPESRSDDELASLTRSFNAMTRQLGEARGAVERNRAQLESANAYLQSILSNLSAGVLVLDASFRLTTANEGAQRILHRNFGALVGSDLRTIEDLAPFVAPMTQPVTESAEPEAGAPYWQRQIEIVRGEDDPPLVLLVRGSSLPALSGEPGAGGHVVVFDDISDVISAQRALAWGEVARRLAHEIKNPLTPIQLSAERLQLKLEDKLEGAEADMLRRSTSTIVNQVASMKRMVDDFREYARTPPAEFANLDLNALVSEVMTLYGWDQQSLDAQAQSGAASGRAGPIALDLDPALPAIVGDASQLRQVIHNLLQNAQDALEGGGADEAKSIVLSTSVVATGLPEGGQGQAVRLRITNNGQGFPARILKRAFEPYITTKAHGTGLGLAIVKKIVDEHGARIDIANLEGPDPEGGAAGAQVSILFTKLAEAKPIASTEQKAA